MLDLPAGVAIVLFGWSNTAAGSLALPLRLDVLGMPGCSARVSPDAAILVTGSVAEATFSVGIPYQPALLGVRYYNQALVPDPGVNALGAVVSDAAAAVIGG